MDPLQLEMFVTTKDCDSVYKAAMLLKRAPKEVQHSIESLEQQRGAKLFFKSGKSLRQSGNYGDYVNPYFQKNINTGYVHKYEIEFC